MVYNSKFEVLTCSLSGIPVRIVLSLKETNPSSTLPQSIAITGFRIKVKDTDLVTEPINGSDLSITFVSDVNFNSTVLYTEDERDWRIDVYFNNSLFWSGFVLPEGFSEPYDNGRYDISLKATDTLGNLKNISYQDVSIYKDFDTDKNVIVKCLAKTGLTLPIVIGVNIFESHMTLGDCPLNQSSINQDRFVDKDSKPFSCHEVLRSILERYGAKIVLAKGEWYIINTLEATKGNIPAYRYDHTGVFINEFNINDVITAGAPTDQAPILDRTHDISKAKAFKSSMAYYQYGFVSNGAVNGDFSILAGGFFANWNKINGVNAGVVNTTTQDADGNTVVTGYRLAVYNADTSIGQMVRPAAPIIVQKNEKVTISFDTSTYGYNIIHTKLELQLIITDNLGNYYTKNGWSTVGAPYGITVTAYEIYNGIIKNISFEIPARSTDYLLTVSFAQFFTPSSNPVQTHFDNLNISVSVDDPALNNAIGFYLRLTQPKNLTYSGEPILLLHGDETSNLRTSQILVNGNQTSSWSRNGFGLADNERLLYIVADSILRLNSRPKNILDAKFSSKEIISPISLFHINQISGNYLLLSGEFDLLNEEYKLILFEGINDNVNVITPYETGTDNGNLKDKTGTSIGQPSGINNPPTPTYDFTGYVKKWETWDDKLIVNKWLKARSYVLPTALDTDPAVIGWQIYVDEFGTGGSGSTPPVVTSLSQLQDVQLGSLVNGQSLVYDSSLGKWKNASVSAGGNFALTDGSNINVASFRATLGLGSNAFQSKTNLSEYVNDLGNYGSFALTNGSNASGNWPINISGNSATSTLAANSNAWGGLNIYLSALATTVGYMMVYDSANNRQGLASTGQLQSFLGIPVGGDTLQSVTDRGASTNKRIVVSGGTGTAYNTSNIELYGNGRAPTLGFHYAGIVASVMSIDSTGAIIVLNNPGTAYENFKANNIYAALALSAGTSVTAGGDIGAGGSITSGNWLYTPNNYGWFNTTHGGGIHMQDASYIRTYGGKKFYCDNEIQSPSIVATSSLQMPEKNSGGSPTGALWQIYVEV